MSIESSGHAGEGACLALQAIRPRQALLRRSVTRAPTAPGFGWRAPRPSRGVVALALLAAAVALASSCRSAPKPAPKVAMAAATSAPDTVVAAPGLRVGILTRAERVSLGADSGVQVWSGPAPGEWVRRQPHPRVTLLPLAPGSGPRFRVQVASLTTEEAARELAGRVAAALGQTPSVRWNAPTRTWRVRVGDYERREEALALAGRLSVEGFGGAQVVEGGFGENGRLRLLETGEPVGAVLVAPVAEGEALFVDASPYRGVVEVRPDEAGTLTVVNVVDLEDYLRGVVPNELSPGAFPNPEALKAQAVAARTYALRNLGGFESRGYDLCATAACQVYRGRASEQPLSDEAVEATRGLVALYQGRPINAYYTSTCGGHTEDGSFIFDEQAPYLKGVVCLPERGSWGTVRSLAPLPSSEAGATLARDAALLAALAVLEPTRLQAGGLAGRATDAELRGWSERLLGALRRQGCDSPLAGPIARRADLWRHLVASLCWDERAARLLGPEDTEYLLQGADRGALRGEGERRAAALLVQEDALTPGVDGRFEPDAPPTRAEAVALLARAALRASPPALLSGEFLGLADGALRLRRGEEETRHPLDPRLRLFRALGTAVLPVSELTLAGGDRVHLVLEGERVAFLEVEQPRLGPSADRGSRYYRWEARFTPAELEAALARYGSVGRVLDVDPLRLGASGRVVELRVVGSEGELTLHGLEVRRGLGLRENLFVIDRERDASGRVARFVFTGKGWGHGVGLCQVGAFGMAEAGADFEQILRHYYTGVSVAPWDPRAGSSPAPPSAARPF